ncbi:hypothetical protein P378_11200 [Desulforamulus profundi]|uniref:L,D-TPase catalytic domain-containing protein n=2 Tax=Desulforamulus profundi TaxID=1383067 RepID=A0A2C6L2L6_9FIRM|nr:hypothetical protein P378_11200 [Desulforamulus profundi]
MSFFIFAPVAGAQESKMIIINKKTNQLGFYQDGVLQRVFPVATGRQRSFTPEGKFRIINKIVNPYYYKKIFPGAALQSTGATLAWPECSGRPLRHSRQQQRPFHRYLCFRWLHPFVQ